MAIGWLDLLSWNIQKISEILLDNKFYQLVKICFELFNIWRRLPRFSSRVVPRKLNVREKVFSWSHSWNIYPSANPELVQVEDKISFKFVFILSKSNDKSNKDHHHHTEKTFGTIIIMITCFFWQNFGNIRKLKPKNSLDDGNCFFWYPFLNIQNFLDNMLIKNLY